MAFGSGFDYTVTCVQPKGGSWQIDVTGLPADYDTAPLYDLAHLFVALVKPEDWDYVLRSEVAPFLDAVVSTNDKLWDYYKTTPRYTQYTWGRGGYSSGGYRAIPNPMGSQFKFREDAYFARGLPGGLAFVGSTAGYWMQDFVQKSFYDALTKIPRASDNQISNIVEIVGMLKHLIVDHRIEVPKSLSEAWLAYRYSFSTTKSDVEQFIDFIDRQADIEDKRFSCYGKTTEYVGDTAVTCRCHFSVKNRELSTLAEVIQNLRLYGLSPSFYVFWDMVPFSFIVDWFIPIGDALSVVDARYMYSEEYFDFKEICYSISYDVIDSSGVTWHQYTRWAGGSPPELNGLYWFEPTSVAQKTVLYRVFDGISLVLGGKHG
jgi:hypothetical protein